MQQNDLSKLAELLSELKGRSEYDSNAPIVVAVDQSLSYTALVKIFLLPGGVQDIRIARKQSKLKGAERLVDIRDFVNKHLNPAPFTFVIEDYAYNAAYKEQEGAKVFSGDQSKRPMVNANFLPALGELGGTIKVAALDAGCKILIVGTSQVKKWATGNGGVKKEAVEEAMRRKYPEVDFPSDNETDAMALAEIGLAFTTDLQGDTPAQSDVLDVLRHPERAIQRKKQERLAKRNRSKLIAANDAVVQQSEMEAMAQGAEPTGF